MNAFAAFQILLSPLKEIESPSTNRLKGFLPEVSRFAPFSTKFKHVTLSKRGFGPPTETEVKRFLARLKVTLFRTNRKSYRILTGQPPREPLDDNDIKGTVRSADE